MIKIQPAAGYLVKDFYFNVTFFLRSSVQFGSSTIRNYSICIKNSSLWRRRADSSRADLDWEAKSCSEVRLKNVSLTNQALYLSMPGVLFRCEGQTTAFPPLGDIFYLLSANFIHVSFFSTLIDCGSFCVFHVNQRDSGQFGQKDKNDKSGKYLYSISKNRQNTSLDYHSMYLENINNAAKVGCSDFLIVFVDKTDNSQHLYRLKK